MTYINSKTIAGQLKSDLIGKDSYRGVTLTYTWLANQFGHFSLGFIPTILVYHLLLNWPSIRYPELWASLGIWSMWILFETGNFLIPLLFKVKTKRKALSNGQYTFTPAWINVAFDTLTDLGYFGLGALAASLFCNYHQGMLIAMLVILTLLSYPAYYWFTTKMYLQNACYPFQMRLSQWNQDIKDNDRASVLKFLSDKEQGRHMLIFGSRGSGKTTLSVSIATEASIKADYCSYVTAVKLLSLFFDKPIDTRPNFDSLWSWRNSNMLVIDDINPGHPVRTDIITTQLFHELLINEVCKDDNIKHIKEKNIIWVMGSSDPTSMLEEKWKNLLEDIGIPKSKITAINLD